MDDLFERKQRACLVEIDRDLFIGFICRKTGKLSGFLGQNTVAVDGTNGGDIVILADVKVVYTVSGSGVDTAGTALERDMLADDQQGFAVEEGVLGLHILELSALDGRDHLIVGQLRLRHRVLIQIGRHDIVFVAAFDDRILVARAYADRKVRGQRPCGGRPNDEEHLIGIDAHRLELAEIVGHTELDIDGMAGILGVFDLCFRESRLTLGTPVNGLETLVDIALVRHFGKDLDLLCLKLVA